MRRKANLNEWLNGNKLIFEVVSDNSEKPPH